MWMWNPNSVSRLRIEKNKAENLGKTARFERVKEVWHDGTDRRQFLF